jgi:hypothetical protein
MKPSAAPATRLHKAKVIINMILIGMTLTRAITSLGRRVPKPKQTAKR